MASTLPDIELLDRSVNSINVSAPENSDLSGIGLDFSIKFSPTNEGKFSILLGVNISELNDSNEDGEQFMSIEMVGHFKTKKKGVSALEHFIAANMIYPELRMLCVRMLDYMKVDASDFPLSVPSSALANQSEKSS